jgi:hypothetical protein
VQLSFLSPTFLIECQLLGPAFVFKGQLLGSLFLLERRSLSSSSRAFSTSIQLKFIFQRALVET